MKRVWQKLNKVLNKRKSKNKKKRSGKKRRIIRSAVLAGNLFFGNLETKDLKTNPTPLSHERVISNQAK